MVNDRQPSLASKNKNLVLLSIEQGLLKEGGSSKVGGKHPKWQRAVAKAVTAIVTATSPPLLSTLLTTCLQATAQEGYYNTTS